MIYSVSCEYGIRALARLGEIAPPGRYVLLTRIVEGTDLPRHFVGKVLQQLVRADVLASARGRGGGFALRRRPENVSLREIVEAIDGLQRLRRCVLGFAECDDDHACPQHEAWKSIRENIERLLDGTTLADLITGMTAKNRNHRHEVALRKK